MTNGSSQGLFVIVAVVIFGIFVAISYLLFRDQLTPSLANIFHDSTIMPTTFYLADTPKGKEYTGKEHYVEYVKVSDFDLSKIGDIYSEDSLYELSFTLKTKNVGKVQVYAQNGDSWEYQLLFYDKDILSIGYVVTKQEDTFITFTKNVVLRREDFNNNKGKSHLAFYSSHASGNKVTVKDISIRRLGTIKYGGV